MYSVSGWSWVTAVLTAAWLRSVSATALSVTPSTTWLGNDGSWSPIQIRVGTPSQWAYVLVSTASSETWVIGNGGCDATALCASMRGGLFNTTESSSWQTEGFYDFQMDARLGFSGYGFYGWDAITFGTTGVTLPSTIIASVNTTEYWNGFFGVGIVPGNFTSAVAISPISGLVETEGVIPSHSYGYTAGAKYQLKGEPVSLTLGGYDANRFVPHDISFQLNPSQQPQVYLDSISVMSSATSNNWSIPVDLSYTSDRIYAIIDSSTPYLWLPPSVCDRFASSLGLVYNNSLNLYTFDGNSSQHDALQNADLTFTFNLSDYSSSVDLVSITLPYAAFDLQLSYPAIPNTTYGSSEATKYYFPLRQASTEDEYTIGRAFLQEAYLITDYERNTFSVHQAVHTDDPIGNTSIVDIERYSDTDFSDVPSADDSASGLGAGAIAGIVVGIVVLIAAIAAIIFFLRRRNHRKISSDDGRSSSSVKAPRTFLSRILHRRETSKIHESPGNSTHPVEMAIESHERYELPASVPGELESDSNTLAGTADDHSTQATRNLSAYERARLKHEQQASQMRSQYGLHRNDRSETDGSPRTQYGSPSVPDMPSPLISSMVDGSYGAMSVSAQSSQPSPVSPAFRPNPASQNEIIPPPMSPPPTYRRISPSNAVYAGRIPDNVQLPEHIPTVAGADGRTLNTVTEPASSTLGSHYTENEYDTMGNIYDEDSIEVDNTHHAASEYDHRNANTRGPNWPLDEQEPGTRIIGGRVVQDEDETKFRREDIQALRHEMQSREPVGPYEVQRRLDGEDLVHVPVPAENRFSWESDGRAPRT
ncbi:eukaryotic aspartyl protease [Phlyctema vagabunda]|uniref:Eukaryotic aspartyl protease n=1 Tax=Phlyctema vagabunda TaxID=108571 RepID=A0ABR4PVF5_9HELO